MALGFNVKSQSGVVQIDGDYANYYLAASGSSTTNAASAPRDYVNNNAYKKVVSFTNTTGQFPLVFIQCTRNDYVADNQFYYFSVELTSPSSFNVLATSGYDTSGSSVFFNYLAVGFNWRVYLPQSTLSPGSVSSGMGLNIYNASGNPVFSSTRTDIMNVSGIYDVYGALSLEGPFGADPANFGRYLTPTQVSSDLENPFFLVNQSAVDQAANHYGETLGVWIGAKTKADGNKYLCGFGLPTSRTAFGIADVVAYTGDSPTLIGFISDAWRISAYNSLTGVLTIVAIERTYSGPLTVANFPVGSEIVITNNLSYPAPTVGPYTVTDATNGANDSTMYLTINTGLSIPIGGGYTTTFLITNAVCPTSNTTDFGIGLMRVPGVIVLKN